MKHSALDDIPQGLLLCEFLEKLQKRGFTHVAGRSITSMLRAIKTRRAFHPIVYWRVLGAGEDYVCLMVEGIFKSMVSVDRKEG